MAGIKKDARVTIGVQGAEDVKRAADETVGAWTKAGQAAGSTFRGVAGAVGESVQGIVSDLSHVVTAIGALNMGSAVQHVRSYEDATARMATATGHGFEAVRAKYEQLGKALGEKPEAAFGFEEQIRRTTYDADFATSSMMAFGKAAALSGRQLGDFQGLATSMHNVAGITGDVTGTLRVMSAQADHAGIRFEELGDRVQSVLGGIPGLSVKGEEGLKKLSGFLAEAGRGMNPQQAVRAETALISQIASDPRGFERFLGMKRNTLTDEHGGFRTDMLPEVIANVRGRLLGKAHGDASRARMIAAQKHGYEAANLLFGVDVGAAYQAGKIRPEDDGGRFDAPLGRFLGSDAGQRRQREAERAAGWRSMFGSNTFMGGLVDNAEQFATDHPIGSILTGQVGLKLAGMGVRSGIGWLQGLGGAAGGGATAAGEGVVAGAGGSGLLGALGLGGLAGGAALAWAAPFLSMLGEGSAVHQGFDSRTIGAEEGADIAKRAKDAEDAAAGNRSPGMQSAVEAEQTRVAARRAEQEARRQGPSVLDLIATRLERQGASPELARQTAVALATELRNGPIPVYVIDAAPTAKGATATARATGSGRTTK
jgi:hypothetical protein